MKDERREKISKKRELKDTSFFNRGYLSLALFIEFRYCHFYVIPIASVYLKLYHSLVFRLSSLV